MLLVQYSNDQQFLKKNGCFSCKYLSNKKKESTTCSHPEYKEGHIYWDSYCDKFEKK